MWWIIGVVSGVLVLLCLVTLVCYLLAFYVPESKKRPKQEFDIPPGKIYEPFREQMIIWMKEVRALHPKEYTVRSFDGLTLYAKYYEYAPGAPLELMFHGYRGNADRDLCGGVQRCFALGRSALIVDQRAAGKSEGHTISFGVNERKDCLAWLALIEREFGPEQRVILTGISMGAATVLMAAGEPLPKQVIGIQADCGYSSAKEIICKVIRQMGLPAKLLYPFVKLAARVIGRFDLEEAPPIEALGRTTKPVLLLHGEADDYVPCEMSDTNFKACISEKQIFTVPDAGHGLAYLVDPDGYLAAFKEFETKMEVKITR